MAGRCSCKRVSSSPWDEELLIPRRTVFGCKELAVGAPVLIGRTKDCDLRDYSVQRREILRTISEGDADDWRQSLAENYADATINKFVKRARQFFKAAVRKGLADFNPFLGVRGASEQNDARKFFVDQKTTQKVLNACPNVEWRLIVALARFGGIRTPSEFVNLRWIDINWDNGRFTVSSPKTKKLNKPWRVVPLFPELREIMAEALEQAPDCAEIRDYSLSSS